ncbi:hypothetical protein BVRB_4g077020 [Beta vulgaris subsp. vulgaris]|nr:hypothetical protein BVRB_4g077020 [Beta vulgaris subsp. vulgaris]
MLFSPHLISLMDNIRTSKFRPFVHFSVTLSCKCLQVTIM